MGREKTDNNSIEFRRHNSEGETPGPIPNPEAKPFSADGTALVTGWESRTPPDIFTKGLSDTGRPFVVSEQLPLRRIRSCHPHLAAPGARLVRPGRTVPSARNAAGARAQVRLSAQVRLNAQVRLGGRVGRSRQVGRGVRRTRAARDCGSRTCPPTSTRAT